MTLKVAYNGSDNPMNETLFVGNWKYRRYGRNKHEWILNNLQLAGIYFNLRCTVIYAGTSIFWPALRVSEVGHTKSVNQRVMMLQRTNMEMLNTNWKEWNIQWSRTIYA